LNVASTYFSTRISWANVEQLPSTVTQKEGVFLETPEGKRYPPIRGLAKRLLQRYSYLIQKRQHWNYYSIDDDYYEKDYKINQLQVEQDNCEIFHKKGPANHRMPAPVAVEPSPGPEVDVRSSKPTTREPAAKLWVCPSCMKQQFGDTHPGVCPRCGDDCWEAATPDVWRDPERCGIWWRGLWQARKKQSKQSVRPQRPGLTPAQCKIADALYTTVRARTPSRALAYSAARQLVLDCGEVAVERALELLTERRNVFSAAGFMMSVLCGATGQRNGRDRASTSMSHQDWVAQVKQSPYACFYANEV
jgi:hypothetical protein